MQLRPKRMSEGQSVSVSAAAWVAMQRNRRRRRNAAASGAGSAAEMPGDFVAQYRAAMLALSVGDPVDVWPDMSGNVYDAWQDTVSCQPTLQSVAFAGKTFPVVRFDTVDDGMATPLVIPAEAPFSIFVVWRPSVIVGSTNAIISSGSVDWSMGTFSGGMLCYFSNWTSGGAVNTSDFFLFEVRISSADQLCAVFLNGVQCGAEAEPGLSGPEQVTFGTSGSNGYPAACDCAEIIIYDRFLSEEEAEDVRAYFQDQYNYLKL
ncbi:MAG: hypothetical protein JWO95_3019 [Verrucomicrobiales bacterium]|nr:hypothetical protein [Verrucomicrobiales bacterium]